MKTLRNLLASLLVLTAGATARGGVKLAGVFGDHMVLQRGKAVPVWGNAAPGQRISVSFGGQQASTTAGAHGEWLVRLAPMAANTTGQTLTGHADDGSTVTVRDILVGDVWIAGGQSNMGRSVSASWMREGQEMDYPHIRCLPVVSPGAKYPQRDLVPPKEAPKRKVTTQGNVWFVCTDETTPECCAEGFFFAELLLQRTGVPQGLLWNAVGGSVAREWIPRFGWSLHPDLADDAREVDSWYPSTETGREAYAKTIDQIDVWRTRAGAALAEGAPFPYPQPQLPEPADPHGRNRGTTFLYNGRTHPLVPAALAGIIWHQGESDCRNRVYRQQIEAMVGAWRKLFAAPGEKPIDIPFYYVQMQRSGTYMTPEVRDWQYQHYFTVPNAGMAVLIDLDKDLHPRNKYDAGRRMALWALAKYYGSSDVVYSGPIYRRHRTEGDAVVVEFDFAYGELFIGQKDRIAPVTRLPDGKLVEVEVTADGRTWVKAETKLVDGGLVAWADGVAKPTDVRYCWDSVAEGPFLYNKHGLPAGQFNTWTLRAVPGRGEGQ